jgi:hypothetical protein
MTPRTDRAVLEGLLERVRAAKWPDRELDALVIVAAGAASEVNPRSPTFIRMLDQRGRPDEIYCRSAEVTSSLDAARDLIARVLPQGWWSVEHDNGPTHAAAVGFVARHRSAKAESAEAATPALALCAALLTALLAQTTP